MDGHTREQFHLSSKARERLRALGVTAVYLFGSRRYGVASPISDFDFGILLIDPQQVRENSFDVYGTLYEVFSGMVRPVSLEADVIDLVFLDSPRVPLELKFHIIRHGQIVFDDTPRCRADFEAALMLKAADFVPLKEEMSAALLARI